MRTSVFFILYFFAVSSFTSCSSKAHCECELDCPNAGSDVDAEVLERYFLLSALDQTLDSLKLEKIVEGYEQGTLIHRIFPNKIYRHQDENCLIFFADVRSFRRSKEIRALFTTQSNTDGIYNLSSFLLRGTEVVSAFFINDFKFGGDYGVTKVFVVLTKSENQHFTHIFAESCGNAGCGIAVLDDPRILSKLDGVKTYEEFMKVYEAMDLE